MHDDISFLVQETFLDAARRSAGTHFAPLFDEMSKIKIPESSGLFYVIHKNTSTFVVRALCSNNLNEDYKKICESPESYSHLRLDTTVDIEEQLHYFECDDISMAQKIKANFANKRFPRFEENVLNISDPGDSWWMKKEEKRIILYFKLSHTQDMTELIKLGPLLEGEEAQEAFTKLGGYFQMLFPIADYASGFGQFSLACTDANDKRFQELKNLFETGDTGYDFWDYLRSLEADHQNKNYIESLKAANNFMMELSQFRTFWVEVQKKL